MVHYHINRSFCNLPVQEQVKHAMSNTEATRSVATQATQVEEGHPVTEVLISHWAQMYSECRSQYHDAVFLNVQLERRCESLFNQVAEIHHELEETQLQLQQADNITLSLSRLVLEMLRENPTLAANYREDYYEAIRGPEVIDLTADEEMEEL